MRLPIPPRSIASIHRAAALTAIGAPGGITVGDLPDGGYGMDFNPTVDRIRITTDSGLNFRLNPNDGDGHGN